MKKMLFICLLASTLLSFTKGPKTVNITGVVVDKITHSPLGYATVTIADAETQKVFGGEITDEAGRFTLSVPTGKYDIKIEYLAFKDFLLENIEITEDYDMKIISLETDESQLAEVEVVGERTTVEYKLDKKVFNVGKDLASKGGSVTDILDNVPSVSVDAGGGISLRGSSNVKILINGKPSVLAGNNGLEQLPASLVEKVEVITNPSARYEASGTAGILNIILKKNKRHGLGGSVQLTTGFPAHHRANINVNYKTEKFNLFSNVGYRYSNFFGERTRLQTVQHDGITSILNQTEDQKRNDDHYNFYVGGDYYINEKNTLTASYYHNKLVNTDVTDTKYTYWDGNGVVDSIITQVENYVEPQNYNQLEIDYVKTFDKKGRKFTTNVAYDFWNDDENEVLSKQYEIPFDGKPTHTETRDIESSKDLLIQTDFVSPLTGKSRFEAGFRAEIRRITSDYTAAINEEVVDKYDNVLNYDEKIYGAYVQYGNEIKKFSYLLGLRGEYSDIGISDRENEFRNNKKYPGLFPTAHLTYSFSETLNAQLSYSRRINRPQFWQLNPFGGLSDSRNVFAGNPDLNPMYSDAYELGVLKRWEKLTFNPAVYYQHNTDFFQFVTIMDGEGAFVTMPVNLSHENRMGIEFSTTYSPLKWLRLSAEFNYYKFEQIGEYEGTDYSAEDDNWSARANARMRFPKGLTMQTTFRYRGENQSGQTLTKAQHSLGFSVSKDLFKDKASIALNFRNILDSRIQNEIITGENFRLESAGKRIGRRISATFTYRFNRKKNERDRMHGR